jgi:hypothetical protein
MLSYRVFLCEIPADKHLIDYGVLPAVCHIAMRE